VECMHADQHRPVVAVSTSTEALPAVESAISVHPLGHLEVLETAWIGLLFFALAWLPGGDGLEAYLEDGEWASFSALVRSPEFKELLGFALTAAASAACLAYYMTLKLDVVEVWRDGLHYRRLGLEAHVPWHDAKVLTKTNELVISPQRTKRAWWRPWPRTISTIDLRASRREDVSQLLWHILEHSAREPGQDEASG
jgi:hypothetical protein